MVVDLYKIQQEKEKPRKKKVKQKMIGFSVQKKTLETTNFKVKVKTKKND